MLFALGSVKNFFNLVLGRLFAFSYSYLVPVGKNKREKEAGRAASNCRHGHDNASVCIRLSPPLATKKDVARQSYE